MLGLCGVPPTPHKGRGELELVRKDKSRQRSKKGQLWGCLTEAEMQRGDYRESLCAVLTGDQKTELWPT